MSKGRMVALVAAGVVAGGVLAGTVGASAVSGTPTPSPGARPGHPGDPGRPHPDETPLTGDTADKVKAAVLAKYPGATFVRVETDSDGVYEAHITTKDGRPVRVEVDKDFTVTGEEKRGPGEGRGDRGPHGTPLTGDALAKVKAAVAAKYPGATVDDANADRDGSGYDAFVTKKDGTRVVVELDKSFTVTGERAGRPGGPGDGPHGAPLTGDALAKVTAAVTAKYPGATVDFAEADREGSGYRAFITKKDGSHAAVELDKDYTVTGERSPRGPR